MKKTELTMFYPDALALVFSACDAETQSAINHTSRHWHQIMFKIRENKAKIALQLLGPAPLEAQEKVSFQQQLHEKMQLLDLRAKRLADWFSKTPPNPKYTGEFIQLGLFGGGPQDFKSFASYDLAEHVFHDELFFPHTIIERAMKKQGLSHNATCPLDTEKIGLMELFISFKQPQVLKSYLERFHAEISINNENAEGLNLFEVVICSHECPEIFTVLDILIDYGATLNSDGLNQIYDELKEDPNFDLNKWEGLVSKIKKINLGI